MKKIFLVLAAALCVATVSAQNKFESQVKQAAQTVAAQKWSVGLRAGAGAQVKAECFYAGDKYFEGLLGWGFVTGALDFTVIHNWNCYNWDWTPQAGNWFLDAGVGANIGGSKAHCSFGIAGQVKFGIKFNKVPIRLSIDYTPVIGAEVATAKAEFDGVVVKEKAAGFYGSGLGNFGISATYCF
jgi:hypothetical protein